MRKHPIMQFMLAALWLALGVMALVACGPSGPPTIAGATTAKSVDANFKAVDPTTTFKPTDTFYTSVEVKDLLKGNKVVAKYIFGTQIQEIPLEMDKDGSGFLSFSLKPGANGWPEGDWKVEISLNGTLAQTVEFKVAK